jgi:hypothetical protein
VNRTGEDALKTHETVDQLEICAVEALKALLGEVSVIKLKELKRTSAGPGQPVGVVADIDVLGRRHKLGIAMKASAEPGLLRAALRGVRGNTSSFGDDVTPVFFAPYLSPEAQSVCKESDTAYFDLEGNARLAVGEIFIGKRALQQGNASRVSCSTLPVPLRPRGRGKVQRMPAAPAEVALTA